MDIELMEKQRIEWAGKGRSLVATADEQGRELDTEERRQFEDYMAHADQLQERIKREQELRRHEEAMNMAHQVPTKPELGKEYAQVAGAPQKFRSFGEQMQAVIRAAQPGGMVDPRLTLRVPTGMSEGQPSDGGFLVQTDFSAELLKRAYDTGQVASRCRRVAVSSNANGLKINAVDETSRANGSRMGGVRGYWAAEAGTKTASQPHLRQIELSLKKLVGLCYATDELLADAQALDNILTQGFAEEFGFLLDDAVIRGTGAGQPLGILASPALISQAAEGGQVATTIVAENLMKMYSRMPGRNRQNAVWFINQDIEPQLMQMGVAVGLGGPLVYMPPGGLSQAPYGTIFGRPVVPIEQCSTLGTVGDIIFADLNEYLLIDKGGMQSASSIHVNFVNDETAFRFVYRVDGVPIWASVLTPYQAGAATTLSPYVALATRS